MKYIIDVPDEVIEFMGGKMNVFVEPKFKNGDCKHYALRIHEANITPYTEPDEDEIRQKEAEYGEKAWQLFRNICELDGTECIEAFDTISCRTVLDEMTYSEAKAKYESWKAEKDKVCVGDEVTEKNGIWKGIVMNIDDTYDDLTIMDSSGQSCNGYKKKYFRKTGNHFNEIAELLKKMREE